MTKLYWYINLDPSRHGLPYGDITEIVKRTFNPPSKNYFYLTETIDGYKHIIKDKTGNKLSEINDNGSASTAFNVGNMIIGKLKDQFNIDHEEAREEETERNTRSSMRLMESSGMYFPRNDMMMIESFRRKKRIKARMNRSARKPVKVIKKKRK